MKSVKSERKSVCVCVRGSRRMETPGGVVVAEQVCRQIVKACRGHEAAEEHHREGVAQRHAGVHRAGGRAP